MKKYSRFLAITVAAASGFAITQLGTAGTNNGGPGQQAGTAAPSNRPAGGGAGASPSASASPGASPSASASPSVQTITLTPTAAQSVLIAQMNGQNEVPPVQTQGNGTAVVRLVQSPTGGIRYIISNENLSSPVTEVHIHVGTQGQSGPSVVSIVPNDPTENPITGEFTQADVTPAQAQGINTLFDVMNAIQSGNAYVNVRTIDHPDGEIRGQLTPAQVNVTVPCNPNGTQDDPLSCNQASPSPGVSPSASPSGGPSAAPSPGTTPAGGASPTTGGSLNTNPGPVLPDNGGPVSPNIALPNSN